MRQLEDYELNQTALLAIMESYKERLEKLRKTLEGNLDMDQTNRVRLQITECKALLALHPKYKAD